MKKKLENISNNSTQVKPHKKYVLKKRTTTETQYKIDYEKELNPEQLSAVKIKDGAVLVIAGAGSGKTKTLTYRVARLIEDGVKPENILLLTFTKKASAEMLNRATAVLDDRCENVAGGTFHSFANMILRKYSKILGLKNNFTIMDSADAEDVINHITSKLYPKKDKRFPKKGTILEIYSKSVNKEIPTKKRMSEINKPKLLRFIFTDSARMILQSIIALCNNYFSAHLVLFTKADESTLMI